MNQHPPHAKPKQSARLNASSSVWPGILSGNHFARLAAGCAGVLAFAAVANAQNVTKMTPPTKGNQPTNQPSTFIPAPALPTAKPTPAAVKGFRFRVVGNAHFTEEQIRAAVADQITTIEQSGLTAANADDTAFFLTIYYRKNGYSQVDVKSSIEPGNTLLLRVHEGPLTIIRNVNFSGNTHFTDKALLDYITGSTVERLPGTQKAVPYVEADVKSGADRIEELYHSDGYLDAKVDPPSVQVTSDGTRADITVSIHEGIQYHFGKLTFEGDIIFFPQKELMKQLEVFTSKPYTPLGVTNLERKVVYYYRTRGYFDVKVHAESDPTQAKDGYVPVNFVVQAGEIYRFDGVTQTGLQRLRKSFLPARFKKLKGQTYNPEKVDKIYRELMGT